MGRATIQAEIEKGEYVVSLDYGSDAKQKRITALTVELLQIEADLIGVEDGIAQIYAIIADIDGDINAAIEAFKLMAESFVPQGAESSVADTPEYRAIVSLSTERAEWVGEHQKLTSKKHTLQGDQLSLKKQKAAAEAVVVSEEATIWCADYTLEASGNCATAEIPGEKSKIIILPGCRIPADSDGSLVSRGLMSPEQVYFNAAILPGWQKFKPIYRIATITKVYQATDTANIIYDQDTSSAQNLSVSLLQSAQDVPIEYMACNAEAFREGDRVLVQFEGQSWSNPKIIGFESNPRPCGFVAIGSLRSDANEKHTGRIIYEIGDETRFNELIGNPSLSVQYRAYGAQQWTTIPEKSYYFGSSSSAGGVLSVPENQRWFFDESPDGFGDPAYEVPYVVFSEYIASSSGISYSGYCMIVETSRGQRLLGSTANGEWPEYIDPQMQVMNAFGQFVTVSQLLEGKIPVNHIYEIRVITDGEEIQTRTFATVRPVATTGPIDIRAPSIELVPLFFSE